jgi:hypothetical protein
LHSVTYKNDLELPALMVDAATLDDHFRSVTDIENVEELLSEQPCVQRAIGLLKEHILFSQSGLSEAVTEYPSLSPLALRGQALRSFLAMAHC